MVYKCKDSQGKLLYQKTACAESNKEVISWTPKTEVKPVEQETPKKNEATVIKQGAGGHYFLNGEINSHFVTFVVDTGATMVALPRSVATSASLFCNDKVVMDSANGTSGGCTTTITELKIDKRVLKNVTAVIMPNLSQPLLGMNVLGGLNIEQKEGEMKISDRERK
jgi:clan AA aspartic protease (TIGR02281 family)